MRMFSFFWFVFVSTFAPVTQFFWVLILTGGADLLWYEFALCIVPFWGWYLLYDRQEYLFFLQ